MDAALALLILVLLLGLAFEFVNGFHDAANAIATIVATRVLTPRAAVLMAGVLNFLGALSGTAVATTIGKELVDPTSVTTGTIAAALLAAIIWDLFTWYLGIPSSSSHALLFGTLGATIATAGFDAVILTGLAKIGFGLVYSPVMGLIGGALLMFMLIWLLHRSRPEAVGRFFGRAQVVSSAYMAFSHGSNDGQKTMGILALSLFTYGALGSTFYVPLPIMIASALAMGLGTALGGWRIIRTMGTRIVQLRPVHGFAAETAAGTLIEVATRAGIPISTTHAISGAILGVGSLRGVRNVRWGIVVEILTAWVLTIPACFALGWLLMIVGNAVARRFA